MNLFRIIKNYKTTIQGILIIGTVGLMLWHKITVEEMVAATGVFTALGLFASKDNDVK